MDKLIFSQVTISEQILEAAADALSQCGFDHAEEVLLDYELLAVRQVEIESLRECYPSLFDSLETSPIEGVFCISYRTWAVAAEFDGRYEKSIRVREESVLVESTVLLSGEVVTYGLGVEHNWIDWKERKASANDASENALLALCELIVTEWRDDVSEYEAGADSRLDHIHPRLRSSVALALSGRGEGS